MLTGRDASVQRDITSTQRSQEIVTVDSTVLIFTKTSELGAQPLESTLEISSVGQSLNGSTITCMESSTRDMASMATTTIHIVRENDGRLLADATSLKHEYHLTLMCTTAYRPNPPNVSLEEKFRVDNVTVVLQWTEELKNSLVTYDVRVEPMAHVISSNGRANLTLSYNTLYNVSVVADVCGRMNETTSHVVNYGKYFISMITPLPFICSNHVILYKQLTVDLLAWMVLCW